jgi:hypothetical protein
MRCTNQLHAALGNRARGVCLQLRADFVDDDDFGHVVLDGFDHHGVLQARFGHLHAAGEADARVGGCRRRPRFR